MDEDDYGDDLDEAEDPVGGDNEDDKMLVFGGGVMLGAALLAIVWMVVSVVNGDTDPAPGAVTTQFGLPALGAAATPAPSRQDRCQVAVQTLSAPLQAAQPAMDQWEIHIGAMNKLVMGAITLQQATAFWDRTRVGAEHRIAEFRRSMGRMRRSGVDCPSPDMLARTAAPSLRACVDRVDADMRALRAARTAITTWDMHVADMERLRAGKLSAATAGQMWLAMWHRGQQEVTTYRAAARDVRNAGSCGAASTAHPSQGGLPSPAGVPSMDMSGMG